MVADGCLYVVRFFSSFIMRKEGATSLFLSMFEVTVHDSVHFVLDGGGSV